MGMLAAGLFFLRAWKRSRDRLLFTFGLAFWVMAIEKGLIELKPTQVTMPEAMSSIYSLRLIAFIMIIYAIVDKNRARKKKSSDEEAA